MTRTYNYTRDCFVNTRRARFISAVLICLATAGLTAIVLSILSDGPAFVIATVIAMFMIDWMVGGL